MCTDGFRTGDGERRMCLWGLGGADVQCCFLGDRGRFWGRGAVQAWSPSERVLSTMHPSLWSSRAAVAAGPLEMSGESHSADVGRGQLMIHIVFLQKPSTVMAGLAADESILNRKSSMWLQAGAGTAWLGHVLPIGVSSFLPCPDGREHHSLQASAMLCTCCLCFCLGYF